MIQQTSKSLQLAPSSVVDRLPDPLRDGDKPLSMEEARETYVKIERAAWNTEGRTSKHMRAKKHLYPRILEADRQFQDRFELTTARLIRTLTPYDASEGRLTPWELDQMLNNPKVRRRVRTSLDYHLGRKGGFDFEWIAVTSPTRRTGTLREYIYLWIDDPENQISTAHLVPALAKHLDGCPNAYEEDHQYSERGGGGAITVRHSPPLVSEIPAKFSGIWEHSKARDRPNSTGAQFVATQLPHLPIGDLVRPDRKNPANKLLEGATLAWASPYQWFRASAGVPKLGDQFG